MKYWIKMIAALVMGLIVGTYINQDSFILEPFRIIGVMFFRALSFIIFPLLFFSVTRSILYLKSQKRLFIILIKSIGFFLLLTVIGAAIGVVLGDVLRPGEGINIGKIETPALINYPKTSDYITKIIPDNIFNLLKSSKTVYPIIFAAYILALGIGLAKSKGDYLINLIDSIDEIVHKTNILILEFLPIGVFTYIGYLLGSRTTDLILPYLKLLLIIIGGAFIHIFIIQTLLVFLFTKKNPFVLIHAVLPSAILAGVSGNRYISYSSIVENIEHNMGADREVFTFTSGIGIALSLSGSAISAGVMTLFIAQAYGLDLSVYLQIIIVFLITLFSLKLDGVFKAGLVILSVVLSYVVKLPQEGYALVLGIIPVLIQIETIVNTMGNATVSYIIAHSENATSDIALKDFL